MTSMGTRVIDINANIAEVSETRLFLEISKENATHDFIHEL